MTLELPTRLNLAAHVLDARIAEGHGARVALLVDDRRVTYAALLDEANRVANVLAALQCGIAIFDSAAGGFGGCPYAPGAAGNLATEDLLYMLLGMKIETGVSLEKVVAATSLIAGSLSHAPTSKAWQALAK